MICSEPFLLFQTYTFWALCDLPHFHVSTCFCAHWMPDVGEENRVRLHNHSTIVLSTPSTPSCLRNGKSRGQNFKKKKKIGTALPVESKGISGRVELRCRYVHISMSQTGKHWRCLGSRDCGCQRSHWLSEFSKGSHVLFMAQHHIK